VGKIGENGSGILGRGGGCAAKESAARQSGIKTAMIVNVETGDNLFFTVLSCYS